MRHQRHEDEAEEIARERAIEDIVAKIRRFGIRAIQIESELKKSDASAAFLFTGQDLKAFDPFDL